MAEGRQFLKVAGITLAVYISMKYLLPYVIPFLIAYMLVHILNPITGKLQKKLHLRKELIVSVLLVCILTVCVFVFYKLYCVLTAQIRRIAGDYEYYHSCFCQVVDRCCLFAEKSFGVEVKEIRAFVYSEIDQAASQIRIYLVPGVVNYSVRYLKKLLEIGIFLLMLFVAVILLMRDYNEMKEKLEGYCFYMHIHSIMKRMWSKGGMYMKAQGIIILIITGICTAGLWLLKNPYFLLLGIMIGLTDALPFVGTGCVLLPLSLYLIIQREYRYAAGYAMLFFVTYITREFLEPHLIGGKLGIYPFVMIVVVYAGLCIYGPSGVLLGPVTLLLIMETVREFSEKNTENSQDEKQEKKTTDRNY